MKLQKILLTPYHARRIRNSSVGVLIGFRSGTSGVRFPAGARDFSSSPKVLTGFGSHAGSCSMGTRVHFMISRSILLRMRNVSDKSCTENQNTRFLFNIFFFANSAVCEIMWKNIVQPDRSQMTTWRMRIACWVPKATNNQNN